MRKKSNRPMVSQETLARYFTLRNERLLLDKQSRELNKQETAMEEQIKGMLDKHIKVEPGSFVCRIETGGKYPKWKEEFEKRLGIDAVNQVIASTSPKEVFIVEVAIKDERNIA